MTGVSPIIRIRRALPKYIWLKESLVELIRGMRSGEALPAIKDLRQIYGVSQPTVDRAIQELRSEGLLESRRGSGIYVTPLAVQRTVGIYFGENFFAPDAPRFYVALLAWLQRLAPERGFSLRYYLFDSNIDVENGINDRFMMDMDNGALKGVVLVGNVHRSYLDGPLRDIPFVILSNGEHLPDVMQIDYAQAVRSGVRALAGAGSRRCGLWIPSGTKITYLRQRDAFLQEAAAVGLSVDAAWDYDWSISGNYGLAGYCEFMLRWSEWQRKPQAPDALLIMDDNVTTGVLQAAKNMKLNISQDLKIATHVNKEISGFGKAGVIRLDFSIERIASLILARLEDKMAGRQVSATPVRIEPEVLAAYDEECMA